MNVAPLAALLLLLAPLQTPAQSNTPAPRQIWDFVPQLGLSSHQQAEVERARADYERLRTAVRTASDSNVPPDRLRHAVQEQTVFIRTANARFDALLDAQQKEKLKTLRAPTSTDTDESPESAPAPTMPANRLPPRAVSPPETYRQQAVALRTVYAGPATGWPAPTLDESVRPHFVELGLLPPMPYPESNPYTPAKAALGKQLFFDPALSESRQIACASCHDADLAWTDGRTVSFGHGRKQLTRNAPTVLNAGHLPSLFWDGRAASLEHQAAAVVLNVDEMRGSDALLGGRLTVYSNEFAAVFGSPTATLDRVAAAIATFERTVTSRSNPFDHFLLGDTNALSDAAVRGLHLFRTEARCINCHHGPALTDGRFHNEGLTYYGRTLQDLGRYEITRKPEDVGAFKTPTLRNIARTAPYMHNGLFELDGVLNMYNAGMPTPRRKAAQENDPLYPVKSPLLKPLGLNTNDLADLKAFLESLTETRERMRPPAPIDSL